MKLISNYNNRMSFEIKKKKHWLVAFWFDSSGHIWLYYKQKKTKYYEIQWISDANYKTKAPKSAIEN